jgi:hypothetical protein
MAFSTGLAELDILVVGITQLPNRSATLFANHPHFTAWQNYGNPVAFFRHNFCGAAGASDQLAALAGCHLNIMNLDTGWDSLQRHRVAGLRLARRAALHRIARLYTQRRQYVPFLAVGIMK